MHIRTKEEVKVNEDDKWVEMMLALAGERSLDEDGDEDEWLKHMISLVQRTPDQHQLSELQVDRYNQEVVANYGR